MRSKNCFSYLKNIIYDSVNKERSINDSKKVKNVVSGGFLPCNGTRSAQTGYFSR